MLQQLSNKYFSKPATGAGFAKCINAAAAFLKGWFFGFFTWKSNPLSSNFYFCTGFFIACRPSWYPFEKKISI
ncbi:MAG: hypothetical protein ACTHMC_02645 [Pseudobacter sp.]|uniref:hypothetical protein n=1 Tax=Pseudobacter sp. TaxID=2045420 RepID=UPI003F820620